ncbi:MAG: CARDB domain-containing protein [Halobacteriaceae archaeon]
MVTALTLLSGIAAGATIVTLQYTPVSGAQGTLNGADLMTQSSSLQYNGVDVSQVDVTVKNTGSSSHTGTVYVTVNTGGSTSTTQHSISSLAAGSTTTVTVDITDVSMGSFNGVEVRIEQTG